MPGWDVEQDGVHSEEAHFVAVQCCRSGAQAVLSSSLVRWNRLSSPCNSSTEDQPGPLKKEQRHKNIKKPLTSQMMHTHTSLHMHTHNPHMHTHHSICTFTTPHMHTHHSIHICTHTTHTHSHPYTNTHT